MQNSTATPTPASRPAPTPQRAEPPRVPTSSLQPLKPELFGFEEARHLLMRAGFGGSPDQIQLLTRWGLKKSVDYLVDYDDIKYAGDADVRSDIMREPTVEERQEYRQAQARRDEDALARLRLMRQRAQQVDREQMREIQNWWLTRMIETPRPLEEKLTLLWHGHFATSYRTIENSYHMLMQNNFLRKNAAGNFGDLLGGIIRDPAMLAYLNNNNSRKDRPNENLARELMELFSLGVGNYSEDDIKQGARALTGYTFDGNDFVFQQRNHDTGGKTILGVKGNHNGDDFVKIILQKRECARFIAAKLYKHFVNDFPSGRPAFDKVAQGVVDDLARTLSGGRYELRPVLKRLFMSQHFYDPLVRGEQIKSPVQLIVGAVRQLKTPVRDLSVLNDAAERMGQELFFPPSVKGWDGGRAWINTATMFVRQNIMVFLLTGRRPIGRDALADQERFEPGKLLTQLADAYPAVNGGESAAVLDAMLRFMLGRTNPAGRAALEDFMRSRSGKLDEEGMTQLCMLITSMPEYQLC